MKTNLENTQELAVIDTEIEVGKKSLAALYKRKRELQAAQIAAKWKVEKVNNNTKHQLHLKMLEMASKGMSMPQIAAKFGGSQLSIPGKIDRAWAKEFPAHYKANHSKIPGGLLTNLRHSPPLFSFIKE